MDHNLNYDALNESVITESQKTLMSRAVSEIDDQFELPNATKYTAEEIKKGKSNEILDISRLMMLRLKAGYKVDSVAHNAALSARFTSYQSQFSQKNSKT